VFLVVGLLTLVYGALVCLIKPYKKKEEKEGDAAK